MLSCFKAYDIRGRLPDELNEGVAWRIGRAYAEYFKPTSVVVGGDIRLSTPELKQALSDSLRSAGVNVLDIGLCGTEEVYFSAFYLEVDGGIMVTASHNPKDYNGFKLVQKNAVPVSGDSGLRDIKEIAERLAYQPEAMLTGTYEKLSVLDAYINHLQGYINLKALRSLKLVVNAGNGAAGHVIDTLEKVFQSKNIPIEFVKIHHAPDGHFPHGIPNPLLPENRQATSDAVIKYGADMGIAWDGDFDRCFLFDEQGQFIEGYYIVGLLAEAFLLHEPGAKIIHDPRLTWNTVDIVNRSGGQPVMSKTGHAFIKERMRQEDAVYGGEMSAHHYFRDFAYCDSGMIPWLLVIELLSNTGKSVSDLVIEMIKAYPSSGELNLKLKNPDAGIEKAFKQYKDDALYVDMTDGVSFEFEQWRFNLRKSNTEPLVRLNIETRNDQTLLQVKKNELLALFAVDH